MAITTDALSGGTFNANASASFTHSHAGGAPDAALVLITSSSAADQSVSCTYDGASMTALASTPFLGTGEALGIYGFFLEGVSSGTVNVVVSKDAINVSWTISVITLNGNSLEVNTVSQAIDNAALADPSASFGIGGATSFVAQAWGTGHTVIGEVTQLTGWTRVHQNDMGSRGGGCDIYDTIASSDPTIGYTSTIEDVLLYAVSIKEAAAGGGGNPWYYYAQQ